MCKAFALRYKQAVTFSVKLHVSIINALQCTIRHCPSATFQHAVMFSCYLLVYSEVRDIRYYINIFIWDYGTEFGHEDWRLWISELFPLFLELFVNLNTFSRTDWKYWDFLHQWGWSLITECIVMGGYSHLVPAGTFHVSVLVGFVCPCIMCLWRVLLRLTCSPLPVVSRCSTQKRHVITWSTEQLCSREFSAHAVTIGG